MDNKKIQKLIQSLKERFNNKWMPIDDIKPMKENPRKIGKNETERLKISIKEFPEMLCLRPGIVDADGNLLAGNQRWGACKALGWTEFPILDASSLTHDQLRELTIKDNTTAGHWDWQELNKSWDVAQLGEWGLIMEKWVDITTPAPGKNLSHQKTIKLKFTEAQYTTVIGQLKKIADTPEHAVWKLLGNE